MVSGPQVVKESVVLLKVAKLCTVLTILSEAKPRDCTSRQERR